MYKIVYVYADLDVRMSEPIVLAAAHISHSLPKKLYRDHFTMMHKRRRATNSGKGINAVHLHLQVFTESKDGRLL